MSRKYRYAAPRGRSYDRFGRYYGESRRSAASEEWHLRADRSDRMGGDDRTHGKKLSLRVIILMILGLAALSQVIIYGTICTSCGKDDTSAPPPEESGYVDGDNGYAPVDRDELLQIEAEAIVSGLSLEQKIGQLLLLRSYDVSDDAFCQTISDTHAGGVVLFYNDVKNRDEEGLKSYIQKLQNASDGHMLVCVDEEGGTVVRVSRNRKLRDVSFKSPQYLYVTGGMALIQSDAAEKSQFLRQFGINVNFAPVADVTTTINGFMFERAFGLGAEETAQYVSTVVTAMRENGMGSCIKHFPGYGNSDGDTHNGLVQVDTALAVLRQRDLLPFVAGIEAGADAVMITHTIMTSIDPERPASLSPAVISLLRDELGFEGVVVSDGMDMGAIKEYSGEQDVCVTAFLAGIDLLCTPADSQKAYDALLSAAQYGTISEQKLNEAVTRIIKWKLSLGLYSVEG